MAKVARMKDGGLSEEFVAIGRTKGGRHSDEIKQIARRVYAAEKNVCAVARKIGVPEGTVRKWAKKWNEDPEFHVLCDDLKKSFAAKADEIINSGLDLLKKRFNRGLDFEKELDDVLSAISSQEEEKYSSEMLKNIAKKIAELKLQNVREITTTIGILYDKKALALGESTENTSVKVVLPDGSDEYAG